MALTGLTLLSSNTLWAQYGTTDRAGVVEAGPRAGVPRDPAEDLLVAYGLRNDAAKEAERGNYNQALKKARQAEKMMAVIVRDHPQWKPKMMSYLREQLATHIADYQQKAASAPIPTGRQPGRPIPQETNIPLPGIRDNLNATEGISPNGIPDYAASDKELREELARLRTECSNMARSLLSLNEKYQKTQQELILARQEQQEYRERYEKLLKQVSDERKINNEVVAALTRRLAEAEDKMRQSERARQEAETRANELAGQLAQTQAELERVTRERDQLKAENEQLRAIVELNSPEKTKALLDQNLTLAEQLKAARARVEAIEAQMAGSADEKDVLAKQLNEARSEVDELREQMGLIYDENRGYRRRISELTERLNNLEAEIDATANRPEIDPALAEENRVLKDVIAKQRRTIEMQEQGRKLLIETYKQLKQGNNEMTAELQRLDEESKLDLTDSERRLVESIRNSDNVKDADGTNAVRRSLEIQTLASLADKAFSKARYTSAEQLYRTLYDYQPDHVPGLVNLGTILLYRNKCDEAVEYLTRATRLAPDLPVTYYLAGICYYRQDRMSEAEQMFVSTIELDPANAEAFFYLANIEAISGRTAQALNHFAAAVKLNPALNDAHYNMARLYAEIGSIPDAARAYDRAIKSGAEPDPEFENYLRTHPDNVKKPGADLVAEVQPEQEAARLRSGDEKTENPPTDDAKTGADPSPAPTPEPPSEGSTTAETGTEHTNTTTTPAEPTDPATTEQQEFEAEINRLQSSSAKTATRKRQTAKTTYRNVRVRTNAGGYRHRVKLRLKRTIHPELRNREGKRLKSKSENNSKKSKRRRKSD